LIRHIASLTRAVPAISPNAIAIGVYADAAGALVTAREAGFEGVACVDDAARGLELYCALWSRTHLAWAKRWCEGLLDFVLWMQQPDGQWINFIRDWDGSTNTESRTSLAGGQFWHARAMLALARAHHHFSDERITTALQRGSSFMIDADAPPDVRALHVLAATEMNGTIDFDWHPLIEQWCEEIVEVRDGETLMNSPDERGTPHLWGHAQEKALALASVALARADLLDIAVRSAARVFDGPIESGFDRPSTSAYDVATTVATMSALGDVTKNPAYEVQASLAREWFHGRNSAKLAVYDQRNGRVADGIDDGNLNKNSGAESNIEGGLALVDELAVLATDLDPDSLGPPLPD
jgi:hypothetical protein